MKIIYFLLFIVVTSINSLQSQTVEVNAIGDLELTTAGSKSHYYYNEIDKDHTDLRLGISQLNLLGQVTLDSQWSVHTRLFLERDKGQKFERFKVPQLNIQWLSKNRKFGVTLGNFTNPFGSFNKNQLSTERNFIGLPLAYAYYQNISDKIGYMNGMGELLKIPIDGDVQWGSTNIYYGGYSTGLRFSWNIKPTKINWKLALVTGASNIQKRITDPIHLGLITRIGFQPTYFWQQGFSVSYGTFMQKSEVSDQLKDLGKFTQTIIGTDFRIGSGYFEFSGEAMVSIYNVPQFDGERNTFVISGSNDVLNLSNFTTYLDFKYELPIIQGSYAAYRIDYLAFSKQNGGSQHWDDNVLRHSIAIGYHITGYLLLRATASTQQVDNKNWNKTQRTLRLVLTAHY